MCALGQDVSANRLLKTIAPDCTAYQEVWVHATRVENREEGMKEGGRKEKTEWRDE